MHYYKGSITIILVYVNDVVITSNNNSYVYVLIRQLGMVFEMKHLGNLHHFLGIEISQSCAGLFLSQTKYATDLLTKGSMLGCKPYGSPCNCKHLVAPDTSALLSDPSMYHSIVDVLQYLTLTCPYLSFSMNQACQYMHSPTIDHFVALKSILRYIKGILLYGIHLTKGPLQLTAYSDADWAKDLIDRHSSTGLCVFLGFTLVSWMAKNRVSLLVLPPRQNNGHLLTPLQDCLGFAYY